MRGGKSDDMMAGGKLNRTGMGTSPMLAREMMEGTKKATPSTAPGGEHMAKRRSEYIREAEPIGTVPPPTTLKGLFKSARQAITGEKPTVFIDKVAERMAFERSGVRLYEGLIGKHEALGTFDGGPSREELEHFRGEEADHFYMLKDVMERLGADPTAMTPSADVVAVESSGIGQVIGDPRMDLPQSLHAILVAELADREGWHLLIEMADQLGHDDLAEQFRGASQEEERHLQSVRSWLSAHAMAAAKLFG